MTVNVTIFYMEKNCSGSGLVSTQEKSPSV